MYEFKQILLFVDKTKDLRWKINFYFEIVYLIREFDLPKFVIIHDQSRASFGLIYDIAILKS